MGGFCLEGPNYKIVNRRVKGELRCLCSGFRGRINEDVERLLVNKADKTLSMSDLPQHMQEEMMKHHIGNTLKYDVVEKKKRENGEMDAMFAPLVNTSSELDAMFAPLLSFASPKV